MTYTLRIALFAASLSMLLACGDDSAPVCTAGVSVACVGPGGCAGGQACNAEGTGFADCVCGASDTGTSDTGTSETGVTDTGVDETGPGDSGPGDAGPDDVGFDVGPPAEFNCNPLTGVPCEGATPRCTPRFVDDVAIFECVAEGEGAAGESCVEPVDAVDNCRSGTLCVDTTCLELCNAMAPDEGCRLDGGTCSGLTLATEEVPLGICFP